MERLHLDHNATTPLRPEARAALVEALDRGLGNPSAVHGSGRAARALVDDARERVAAALGVDEDAVVFTSGGTESDNLAVLGAVAAQPGARLVTSALEHAAVHEPARALERGGADVRWVQNDAEGTLDLEHLARLAAVEAPLVVSLMAANSEIGTVNDLVSAREAVGRARPQGAAEAVLHTDAVQALGKTPISDVVGAADLVSLSAHKVGGPVGVGVLVRRIGAPLEARSRGGSQEAGLRAGTESAPLLSAAAVAVELAVQEATTYRERLAPVAAAFWAALGRALPAARLNGPALDAPARLANTVNVSFPKYGDARMLVTRLDLGGVEASAGSACASGSLEPSRVISALGLGDDERVRSAVRFSFGRSALVGDAKRAVESLRITLGEAP
ncbi:MAG: aminotransferase class V-fold PLP-dependent enzyme [Planctomycetota bacterium]